LFPSLWKSFLDSCNPFVFIFSSASCAFRDTSKKSLPDQCGTAFLLCFSSSFIVSAFVRCLICFEFIFVCYKGPISLFCMWISSFSNTTYWKDHPFPIMFSWHLLLFCSTLINCPWILIMCQCAILFQGIVVLSGMYSNSMGMAWLHDS
jgi:hypothetical protein